MTTHAPDPELASNVTFYSEYTTTDSRGLPETIIQFTISWPVDRPHDGIPSAITFDHRDRLKTISLRPGPLKQTNWSYTDARNLLETALNQSAPPFSPSIIVKSHYGRIWRTHIEADGDDATGHRSDILDWLPHFITAYRDGHANGKTTPPTPNSTSYTCFECGTRPATHILECRLTENVDEDLAVCPSCVSKCLSYPFVKPYTSLSSPIVRRPLHG